mmetsp:Transcript_15317/g.32223  ORF Transcript_15317/g.32223 Transcript_15317/m.32223 type:complete len:328 (+) Transcript_15317:515-1498(+)
MMNDEIHLRLLSVSGSVCGIIFNLSRKPPLRASALWGMVFISVNTYHLRKLYLERVHDISFDGDEMMLYTDHFQECDVEPWQFKKLIRSGGCRFRRYDKGDVIIEGGSKPLKDVMMVVRGEVGAEDPRYDSRTRPLLYSYRGDGKNGCVIGGTALVDSSVKGKNYPHRLVVTENDTLVVKWDADKLKDVMESDKDIESAFLQSMYVELIQGLRRQRSDEERKKDRRSKLQRRAAKRTTAQIMSDSLHEFESIAKHAIHNGRTYEERNPDGSGSQVYLELKSSDKKMARVFASENQINKHQIERVLNQLGWTQQEWDDGGKLLKSVAP